LNSQQKNLAQAISGRFVLWHAAEFVVKINKKLYCTATKPSSNSHDEVTFSVSLVFKLLL
jgi:hypothetical protein